MQTPKATCKTSHLGFCTKVGRCWASGDGGPSPRTPTLGARAGRFEPLSPEGTTPLYCSPGLASRFQRLRKVGGRAFQILTITILQTTHRHQGCLLGSLMVLGEKTQRTRQGLLDQITNFCTEQQTANGVSFFVSIPFNDSKIISPFSKDSINPIWDLQW